MKRLNTLFVIALVMLLSACSAHPISTSAPMATSVPAVTEIPSIPTLPETTIPQPLPLTIEQFKNTLINAPELMREVQLTDGKWSENQADGSTQMVRLDEQYAFGDLNSDGAPDAALLIAESMGGTGVFYSITAMVSENGSYRQTNTLALDDRPIIHSIEIVDAEIVLNANIHGPNDAMVDPTLNVTKTYRFFNDKLTLWRQRQLLADGKVRSIEIEAPADYSEVSGEVILKGSMPIAPFENTLLLQIYGEFTMINYANSLMVTSTDVGMLATINTTIPVNMFKSGELVRIQLIEVSMADGSPMAIDTIVVKVK
jgi:hypothetical protein